MLEGAKQEGTSDVAYSRNQPSVLEDDREPQRQSGARSGAQQTSNPKRIADFRRFQVCDSRPPRCTGQMPLGTAQMMVLGRSSRQRVSRIGGANPLAQAAAAGHLLPGRPYRWLASPRGVRNVGSGNPPPSSPEKRLSADGRRCSYQGEIREDRYTSGHHLPRLLVIDSSIEQNGQAGTDENEVRDPTE